MWETTRPLTISPEWGSMAKVTRLVRGAGKRLIAMVWNKGMV